MSIVRKTMDVYDLLEKWALILMMTVLVIVIFAQVFTRYVMGDALYWSEELGKFIFVWMSWLGVSAGIKEKEHIQVKLFPDFLHNKSMFKSEKFVYIIIDALWLLTNIVVVYYGIKIVLVQMQTGVYAASTGIPIWTVYLCIPVCGIAIAIRIIGQIILNIIELNRLFGNKRLEGSL